MITFFVALAGTILGILLLEMGANPRPKFRDTVRKLSFLTVTPPVVFYTTVFMITYRPILSAVTTCVVFAGIVLVNNAKVAILREPLVFSDFALLRQAIRYPALYIRYVGVFKVAGIVILCNSAIAAGLILEESLISRDFPTGYFPLLIYLSMVTGLIHLLSRGPLRTPFRVFLLRFGPTADVKKDMDKLSLVVCLITYFFLANEPDPPNEQRERARALARSGRVRRPTVPDGVATSDLVIIQSESFFDARALHPSIPRQVLERYDRRERQSMFHGRLSVPAWGANTMRSEFAFLTGLPNEALGFHRFNPYLTLTRKPVWTMAHALRLMGYRTICIHPFHATFFDRDVAFPNMGFDRFLDLSAFNGEERFGPYISDAAVGRKILEVLDESPDKPTFVFAITMENHGNWEAGRLDGVDFPDWLPKEPLGRPELGLYLRHLINTDALIDDLASSLETRNRDATLCLYGDHVPPFSPLFHTLGLEDRRTDYLIWRRGLDQNISLDTSVDILGRLAMDAAFTMSGDQYREPRAGQSTA